jgi:hypothetical protein
MLLRGVLASARQSCNTYYSLAEFFKAGIALKRQANVGTTMRHAA